MKFSTTQRATLRHELDNWYQCHKRPMPWRASSDPYAIWVSEVMLQQTQVAAVIPFYERFMATFPTVQALADAPIDAVLKHWEGLGYYARARNLKKAAIHICTHHQGAVPSDPDTFGDLPGVGPYIQAAVLSIAFGTPLAAVDGNVKRVLARLFCIDVATNAPSSFNAYLPLAQDLLNRIQPGDHNQAMMELGARICTPTSPRCTTCPITQHCCAARQNMVHLFPVRIAKKTVPTHRIAVGVIEKKGKLLICKRKDDGLLGGLWEFPGGKIENGETAPHACIRECHEEVGLTVSINIPVAHIRHAYTHFKIEMDVFLCRYQRGRVRLSGPVQFKWVTLNQLSQYPFPGANNKFIPQLCDIIKKQKL